jgi:hypothetical protein
MLLGGTGVMTETTGHKHGGQWQPGQSGNPTGRPKGARHKTTLAIEALLDGEAEALTRKTINKALEGDGVALRLCLDRPCPLRKDRPISLDLPSIEGAQDLSKAAIALLRTVADGGATPEEAASVMRMMESVGKAIELGELESRIQRLEGARALHERDTAATGGASDRAGLIDTQAHQKPPAGFASDPIRHDGGWNE